MLVWPCFTGGFRRERWAFALRVTNGQVNNENTITTNAFSNGPSPTTLAAGFFGRCSHSGEARSSGDILGVELRPSRQPSLKRSDRIVSS